MSSSLRARNEKALALLPLLDKLFSLPSPLLPFKLFGLSAPPGDPAEPPKADP